MNRGLSAKHWKIGQLQDLVFFQRGFDITQAQQTPGPYPVISSSGVTSSHNEFKALGPGVVIGRKGTLGSVHFAESAYWPHDTTLWSKDLKGNNPRFVYYYLHTVNVKRFDVGNSNPTLNRNHIHDLPAIIPPSSVQDRIASILSAYDSLIENNRRRTALLEEAARQLYREWFVRLRFPGREHTRITNSVPEGWHKCRIEELINFTIGGGWGGDDHTTKFTEPAFVIRGTDLPDLKSGSFVRVPFRFHETRNLVSRELQPGDIILEISNGNIRNIGRSYRIEPQILQSFDGKVMCASFCRLLRPSGDTESHFLASHFEEMQFNGRMDFFKTPSAAGINNFRFTALLKEERILIPPRSLLDEFVLQVRNLRTQLVTLAIQNHKLRAARDLLLPRLMSGEIAV